MWFSLSDQTAYFFSSIALGAVLGVLYDLVRAVRIFFKASRRDVILSDIIFFALCGVLTSLFALPFNKGNVRAFIVFGEAVGFLCFRLTLGSVMGRFYEKAAVLIRKILRKIADFIKKLFDLLLKVGSYVVYNVGGILYRILNMVSQHYQKRLAKRREQRLQRRLIRKQKRKRKIILKKKNKAKKQR